MSRARVAAPPVEPLLARLDALRRACLAASPTLARAIARRRERRVAVVSAVALPLSLVSTLLAPLWALALGPIVLGVPHLVADVRHLVVRRPRARLAPLGWGGAAALVACAAGLGARAALVGAAVAAVASPGTRARKAAVVAFAAASIAIASASPWRADAIFLQLHNVLAIAFWWRLRRRHSRWSLVPPALFVLGALVAFFAPTAAIETVGASRAGDLDVATFAAAVSPVTDAATSIRFVLLFAFAQAAHYAVWLHMIPQEDRAREAPLSYAQSYRWLVRDVRPEVVWGGLVVAGLVAIVACFSLALARRAYLGVAFFHAYLEVVVVATALVRRGAEARTAESAPPPRLAELTT